MFSINLSLSENIALYEEKPDAPKNADSNEYMMIETQTAVKNLETLIIQISDFSGFSLDRLIVNISRKGRKEPQRTQRKSIIFDASLSPSRLRELCVILLETIVIFPLLTKIIMLTITNSYVSLT
jgi:hypothetical protein